MRQSTHEKAFEDAIEAVLLGEGGDGGGVAEGSRFGWGDGPSFEPGGYQRRVSADFDPDLGLIPDDALDFVRTTQPRSWARLAEIHGDQATARRAFLKRLARQVKRRGTLAVLRQGIDESGCSLEMAHFRPHSGLNPEHRELYESNLFSVVRQLRYEGSTGAGTGPSGDEVDLVLFLNGLPLFTAELKNRLTGTTAADAMAQYRQDRSPREHLFAFGTCLAHFAVDPDAVYMATHLEGESTVFLPFNRGRDGGAGNPPAPLTSNGYPTSYLWEEVWSRDSVLDLVQHFVHRIQKEPSETTGKRRSTTREVQIFPRYHQLEAVRALVDDARRRGAGHRYLIEHSAGSGKSLTIGWLAHRLSVLHDDHDRRVFDTIVVVTDRRILDQQLRDTIFQLERDAGVVEAIDQDSRQLAEALRRGKQIIVTTLQKFPFVADLVGDLGDRRFAVLVDEAHSSQTGETARALREVLATSDLEEAARLEAGESPEPMQDQLIELDRRRRLTNASLFAFTATPKARTLELFGEHDTTDGTYAPFHLYSMRQAIEEGFILDVLENYTTYETWWKLLKTVEEDPEVDSAAAKKLLKGFVELHPHAIREKVEIMVDHFHSRTAHRIDGRAKAMIVTRSRLHCVRTRQVLDRVLAERGHPYRALVAFSGTVEDGGEAYTESGLNRGIPERGTAAAFEGPEFRFLVVAEKFQTGFDQPLLHTMYVDKNLSGVHAVQTLSRLNRKHPGKNETMVLDFANRAETIQEAFAPYYETTLLSEGTDPHLLYDRRDELYDYAVFSPDEVQGFGQLLFTWSGPLEELHGEIHRALDPIRRRAEEHLDTEALEELRSDLRSYVRLYAFLSQVAPFSESGLENLYQFARFFRRMLRGTRRELPREIQEMVDMDSLRVQKTSDEPPTLERGNRPLDPGGERKGPGAREETRERLSRVIEELNRRYGSDLDEEDEATLDRLVERAQTKESLRRSVENNSEDNARLAFEQVITGMLQDLVDTNFRLYKRIADDRAFSDSLMAGIFDVYKSRLEGPRAGC